MPDGAAAAADASRSAGPQGPAEPSAAPDPRAALGADAATLERLIVALIAEEVGRLRGRPVEPAEWRGWSRETRLTEDGIGLDSLARLEVVTRLDQVFALSETGVEDYLFVEPTIGDWVRLVGYAVGQAPRPGPLTLAFQTSGSTGAPKIARHALDDLAAEMAAQAEWAGPPRRVVALVPPHHIYGFLFTALGPTLWGAAVRDLRGLPPGRAAQEAGAGDLVVATPFLWDLVARSGARFAPGVVGVSSGAPAPAALWPALAEAGLSRLVEVYGSSETAGVGWRDAPDGPFRLLGHLDRAGEDVTRAGRALALQDALAWDDARAFRVLGRRDGAVQVGGVNVHPERVRAALLAHPAAADCAVRLDGTGAAARLKAFVVPQPGADPDALRADLIALAARALSAPERPATITLGLALPRNDQGKLADWAA